MRHPLYVPPQRACPQDLIHTPRQLYTVHATYLHSARERATHGATSVTAVLTSIRRATYPCSGQASQTHGAAFDIAISAHTQGINTAHTRAQIPFNIRIYFHRGLSNSNLSAILVYTQNHSLSLQIRFLKKLHTHLESDRPNRLSEYQSQPLWTHPLVMHHLQNALL